MMPTVADSYANDRVRQYMHPDDDKYAGGVEAIGFVTYPDDDDDYYHRTDATPLGFTWARKT